MCPAKNLFGHRMLGLQPTGVKIFASFAEELGCSRTSDGIPRRSTPVSCVPRSGYGTLPPTQNRGVTRRERSICPLKS